MLNCSSFGNVYPTKKSIINLKIVFVFEDGLQTNKNNYS